MSGVFDPRRPQKARKSRSLNSRGGSPVPRNRRSAFIRGKTVPLRRVVNAAGVARRNAKRETREKRKEDRKTKGNAAASLGLENG